MSANQRYASVSRWTDPKLVDATFVIWPVGTMFNKDSALAERASISIECGAASVSIRPTIAELRTLIETLQWAIDAQEVAV